MKRKPFQLVDASGLPVESGEGVYFVGTRGFDGACKIGITEDLWRRVRNLQSACPLPLFVHALIPCRKCIASAIEGYMHHIHEKHRLNDEWFMLDQQTLQRAITISRLAMEHTAKSSEKMESARMLATAQMELTPENVKLRRRRLCDVQAREQRLYHSTFNELCRLNKKLT